MLCARCSNVEVQDDLFCDSCEPLVPSTSTTMNYYDRRRRVLQKTGRMCQVCGAGRKLQFLLPDGVPRSWLRGNEEHFEKLYEAAFVICGSCSLWERQERSGRVVPHGGGKTGRRNCYCDLCKPLKAEQRRRRRVAQELYEDIFT